MGDCIRGSVDVFAVISGGRTQERVGVLVTWCDKTVSVREWVMAAVGDWESAGYQQYGRVRNGQIRRKCNTYLVIVAFGTRMICGVGVR